MQKHILFESSLAEQIKHFIDFKQQQGYDYTGGTRCMKRFDSFLVQEAHAQSRLCSDDIRKYLVQSSEWTPDNQQQSDAYVRQFSRYLNVFEPQSYLLPVRLRRQKKRPFVSVV